MKKLGLGILIIVTALAISGITLAKSDSAPNPPGKSDLHKPVPATDVELIKKATLGGKPVGKGKPTGPAATGILGEEVLGDRYAIVIGISDYPGTANDLYYADDDAIDMITALQSYGFSDSNIKTFIDKEGTGAVNATRDNILNAISEIKGQAASGSEVVFFFSGHGMKGRADDGDKEAIDESIVVHDSSDIVPIWDGELKSAFSGFATSRIVFIFDSCLAGGMTDLKTTGRILNMATTETGTAYEFDSLQNGQFSYYFVDEGMLQGLADKYDSIEGPDVTIEEAFDYSKANCLYQTPTINDQFPYDLLL